MEMTGRIASVTGVSSGIGKTTSCRFAEADASVMLTGRREKLFKKHIMKYVLITILTLFALAISSGMTACTPDNDPVISGIKPPTPEPDPEPDLQPGNRLRITIGPDSFTATLAENATAIAFGALLPMTISMNEMNGNEKYYYIASSLPAAAANPGTIQAGDLMLYGTDCVVLFYETFRTTYSYTRIGSLDDPSGLAASLGSGSVSVRFELI